MKRNIDINEITDGKRYTANDMVKVDCHDCQGCSACCQGMGDTIVLDPYDMWQLTAHMRTTFDELFEKYIGLHLEDGLILPHLKLDGADESCAFLTEEGRCSIHAFRPGICRLFPLGRIYTEDGFQYIHQIYECPKQDRSKVKIKKWLGIPDIRAYEQYIKHWHDLIVVCRDALTELREEEQKTLALFLLKSFYQTPYPASCDAAVFYTEFYQRLQTVSVTLGLSEE